MSKKKKSSPRKTKRRTKPRKKLSHGKSSRSAVECLDRTSGLAGDATVDDLAGEADEAESDDLGGDPTTND
jgi:hypothetical protein